MVGNPPTPLPEAICCPVSVCDCAHQPRDDLGPFPVKVMARPCPPTLPQSDLGARRWSRPLPTPPQSGPAPLPLSSRSALTPARNARSLSFPSRCTPPHTAVAAPHTPCLFPLLSCAAWTGGHVPTRRGGTGGHGANEGLRSSQWSIELGLFPRLWFLLSISSCTEKKSNPVASGCSREPVPADQSILERGGAGSAVHPSEPRREDRQGSARPRQEGDPSGKVPKQNSTHQNAF